MSEKASETPRWRKVNFGAYCDGCSNVAEWALNTGHAAQFLCDKCRITYLEAALQEAEQQRESFREFVLKWGDGGTVEKENDARRYALADEVDELQAKLREAEAKAALADECYRRWDADEEVSMHWRNSDTWQAGWLKRYDDALQQPKVVSHREADKYGDGFGN